jgi:hypothetical protein
MGIRSITEPECPKDCRFFVDRAKIERERKAAEQRALEDSARVARESKAAERRARWCARLLWPVSVAGRFLAWYAKAPWETQVILLFVALVILAPVWAKSLAELLKPALHGK